MAQGRVLATGPTPPRPNPLTGIGRGVEQFFRTRDQLQLRQEERGRREGLLGARGAFLDAIVGPGAGLPPLGGGISQIEDQGAGATSVSTVEDPLDAIRRRIAGIPQEELRLLDPKLISSIFLNEKEGSTSILTPAEAEAAGFRKGTTVQRGPGGLKVLQSPEKDGTKGPPAPRPVPFAFKKGETVPENLVSLFPRLSIDEKTGIALKDLRGKEIREFDAESNTFIPRRIVSDVPPKPEKTEKFREFLPDQIKRAAIIDVLKASGRPDALSLVLAGGEIGDLSALGLNPEEIQVRELELIEAQLKGTALTDNARKAATVFVAQEVAERTENAKALILELQAKGATLDKIEASIGTTEFVDQAAIKRFIAQLRTQAETAQAERELQNKSKEIKPSVPDKAPPQGAFQLPDKPLGPLGVISSNPLFQR